MHSFFLNLKLYFKKPRENLSKTVNNPEIKYLVMIQKFNKLITTVTISIKKISFLIFIKKKKQLLFKSNFKNKEEVYLKCNSFFYFLSLSFYKKQFELTIFDLLYSKININYVKK